MKSQLARFFLPALCVLPFAPLTVHAAGSTGSPFYGDAPDEHHPWAIHDQNRPEPKIVTPGTPSTPEKPGLPPSDAHVLFDGTEATLAGWEADKSPAEPTKWIVKDGAMQCVPGAGYIRTKEQFGDCQLHVEWAAPAEVHGDSQGRGNSGVFLMGQVEVQVLDVYNNPTYADGGAGSVYGVNPAAANAVRPPGQWQSYDIIFRRPVWKDGKELDPGRVTVLVNGVVTQDATPLEGGTGHRGRTKPGSLGEKGSLKLQDHGNPVRYRNIWYRDLPKRAVDGGTDGALSAEATMAKRKETAARLREDAAKQKGVNAFYRLAEALTYEADAATVATVTAESAKVADEIAATPADKIDNRKGDAMRLKEALGYLIKFKALPESLPAKATVEKLIKDREWDKKK